MKNTEGELSRYNPEKSITLFLKNMDEAFSEQIEKFEDNSTGCDLSNPEGTSALEDHHISYPEDFGATQYLEFRKLDCAFEAMKKTGYFLCETEETISSEELMRCNTIFQEETLPRERDLLQRSLEVALRHVSELSVAWPLHQRMQCLNERLARERELLVETVQWLSKIQRQFPILRNPNEIYPNFSRWFFLLFPLVTNAEDGLVTTIYKSFKTGADEDATTRVSAMLGVEPDVIDTFRKTG